LLSSAIPLEVLYITIMQKDVNSNSATGSTCLALGMKARCKLRHVILLWVILRCYLASGNTMIDIEKCLKGSGRRLIEVQFWYFRGVTKEDYEKRSVRIAGVPTEIRTEPLQNRSLAYYRQANLSGVSVLNVKR
jgi:hypothetical protein